MTRKTTQSKKALISSAIGNERPERLKLAEGRAKLYENFYNNIRVLCAYDKNSMVELARSLGLKSGSRLSDFCYGKGVPSTEELMVLAKYFKCSIDDLLYKSIRLTWI